MDKPTYEELEAEVARLRNELKIVYASLDVETNDRNRWKQEARDILRRFEVALDERDEARRWARQKRQEAEQWKRWYLEVKANVMGKKDGHEHPDWLPSDDPDWIPF